MNDSDLLVKQRFIHRDISNYADMDLKLCMAVDRYRFFYTLQSCTDGRVLAVVAYDLNQRHRFEENIRKISSKDPLLSPTLNYQVSRFRVLDFKSTLFPSALYVESRQKKYLEDIFDLNHKEILYKEDVPYIKSYVLSAVNSNYIDVMRKFFPKAEFQSVYAHLLDCCLRLKKQKLKVENTAFLHVRKGYFDLLVFKQGELVFANSFLYPQKETLLYYNLFTLNSLKMDLGDVNMWVCGDENTPEVKALFEPYVYEIGLLPPPTSSFPEEVETARFVCSLF